MTRPTTCSWCEEPFLSPEIEGKPYPRKVTIQMTTSHGSNRLTWEPFYFCSTGCMVGWARNLDAENPEWHRPASVPVDHGTTGAL